MFPPGPFDLYSEDRIKSVSNQSSLIVKSNQQFQKDMEVALKEYSQLFSVTRRVTWVTTKEAKLVVKAGL